MNHSSHPIHNLINHLGSNSPSIQEALPRLSDILSQNGKLSTTSSPSTSTYLSNSNDSSSSKPSRPKYKRSRDGCLTCRKRKVKCDMVTPTCLKCTSLGRECVFPNPNSPHTNKRRKTNNITSNNTHDNSNDTNDNIQNHLSSSSYNQHQSSLPHFNPYLNPQLSLKRLENLLGHKLLCQLIQSAPDIKHDNNFVKLEPSQPSNSLNLNNSEYMPKDYDTGSNSTLTILPPPPLNLPSSTSNDNLYEQPSSRVLQPGIDQPNLINSNSLSAVSIPFSSLTNNLLNPSSPFTSEYASFLSSTPLFNSPSPILNDELTSMTPTNIPTLMSPDILSNSSNSLIQSNNQSRQLLHNFLNQSKKLLCAINEPNNPFLALSIPLVLHSNQSAITYGVLAISATHMHFIRQKQGLDSNQELNLSKQLKNMALKQVMMPLIDENASQDIDMSLLAFIAVLKYDVLSASKDWRNSMNVALALIKKLGGPSNMLKSNTFSKRSFLIRKIFLEELTAHEVFACLTTGDTPQLIGNSNQRWWFDMKKEVIDDENYEESFENSYGMSRHMLDIIARSCKLYSQRKVFEAPIPFDDIEFENLKIMLGPQLSMTLQSLRSKTFELYNELETMAKEAVPCKHQRVHCGDLIYRRTLMIFLSREIFNIPIENPDIQAAARAVLELCSEATSVMGMAVMLIWALIISGVQMYKAEDRSWLLSIFKSCRDSYCSDLDCAEKIVKECWFRFDNNHPASDWRSVAKDLRIDVMML